MNITQVITRFAEKLLPAYQNKQTAFTVAWWLVQKATGKTRTELLLQKEYNPELDKTIQHWIDAIVQEHMPVQYILGSVPFGDLDILVKPPILIPRPETEQWTQKLIGMLSDLAPAFARTQAAAGERQIDILDLCSGTGCIALSLAQAFPQAHVTASDINGQACALIRENMLHNQIKNCTVLQSDLFDNLQADKKYSLITANPPYISLEEWKDLEPCVKIWESPQALIAQQEGLKIIEKIIYQAPDYLGEKIDDVAQLWIEIGAFQAEKVYALYQKAGYKEITILQDMYGKNRVVTGNL